MNWMKVGGVPLLTAAAAALVLSGPVSGQDEAPPGFVGADGCKICHKKEADGNQYGKWLESPHAGAWKTLGTPEAAEVVKTLGLEGNPQEMDECLQCHVTAHGVAAERLGKKYAVEQGVGCESCHGPGEVYKKKSIMQDRDAAMAAGMVIPTADTCTQCHNDKSPTFDGFDFEEMKAKIAHPYPEKAAEG